MNKHREGRMPGWHRTTKEDQLRGTSLEAAESGGRSHWIPGDDKQGYAADILETVRG